MTYEETKKVLFDFLNPVNFEKFDLFQGTDVIEFAEQFFNVEQQRIERQMQEDVFLTSKDINTEYLEQRLKDFVGTLINVLEHKPHTIMFRRFQEQVQLFLNNWVNVLDKSDPKCVRLYNAVIRLADELHKKLVLMKSLEQLIDEVKKQAENLRKWNSFRPAGFDVAPHLLDVMFEDLEKNGVRELNKDVKKDE